MGTETEAPAVTAVWTRQQLEEATLEFIERHWPKNDTAAHGGPATPGRGEAMATVGMFLAELPESKQDPLEPSLPEGEYATVEGGQAS